MNETEAIEKAKSLYLESEPNKFVVEIYEPGNEACIIQMI